MSSRVPLSFAFVFLSSLVAFADEDDPKEKIFKAKAAYTAEIAKLRSEVTAGFEKREEKARNAGNKKLVDEIKFYRTAFDEEEEWPTDLPVELRTRLTKARTQVEAAYLSAVKDYTKAKKDEEAATTEKDLAEFRKMVYCPTLDLSKAEIKEGFFRIPPNALITTKKPYKGALEIALVARTEAENIRLHAHRGACVIFNWEINPAELRITRPDGREEFLESGSLATAKVTPLKPNTYYTLKWLLTPQGMAVSVNGQLVFTERKEYNLEGETKIALGAGKSKVDIKEFKVTRIFVK